jgi:hypothetical protein
MTTPTFNIGDEVIFGRPNGEQTRGRVVRVNRRSISVEQTETRGQSRIRKAGVKWRVGKTLVRHADGAAAPALTLQGLQKSLAVKRQDALIIQDLQRVEASLSPENLHWDGERSASQARAAERRLLSQQRALHAELGRQPTHAEMWGR